MSLNLKTKSSILNIAFCETVAQVKYVLTQQAKSGTENTLVALRPEIAWELQKRRIPYLKLEDFYEETQLCDLGQPVLSLFADWMNWVDDFVQAEEDELRRFNFRPIQLHFHFMKIFVDELVLHRFILKQFLEKYRPEKVYCFPYVPLQITEQMFFKQSPLSILLPLVAAEYGVKTEVFYGCDPRSSDSKRISIFNKWFALRHRLLKRISVPKESQDGFEESTSEPRVVALRKGYDISSALTVLEDDGIEVRFLKSAPPPNGKGMKSDTASDDRWNTLWNKVSHKDEFWKMFDNLELLIAKPFLEKNLSAWWKTVLPMAWSRFLEARKYLGELRPAIVVTPTLWGHRDTTLMAAAMSLGIRRVMYQHGGFVGSCDYWGGWEYTDFLNSDHYFLYGEGMKSYFLERSEKYNLPQTEFHVVGSSRLDQIRSREHSKEVQSLKVKLRGGKTNKLVLYITDMIMGYQRGLRYATYPAVRYFEFLQKTIEIFRQFPEIRMLYKGISTTDKFFNPIPELIRKELPNALLVSHLKIPDLIWCADAIIIDNPSTSLLEALLTSKQILVYSDKRSLQLRSEAKSLLQKRVLFTETAADFFRKLSELLTSKDFSEITRPNTEFLQAYGTHQNDGHSAERAAETLRRVLSQECKTS